MYKAFSKVSGMHVAIKKTQLMGSDARFQSESELLMKCDSTFIVRYNGVVTNGRELWVGDWRSMIHGVLSLWLSCILYTQWKSFE